MCNTELMDQAVDWVIESTWKIVFENADAYEGLAIDNLIFDVIHLDNQRRGVVGYKPDLNFDFAIGL